MRLSTTDGSDVTSGGNNSFSGSSTFNGAVIFGRQSFTLNGSTQTASATGGSIVEVSGSTSASTINLPASPTAGLAYIIVSSASVNFTLGGNGFNIDGAGSLTVLPGMVVRIEADGSSWHVSGVNNTYIAARYAALSGSNTFGGNVTFGARIIRSAQSFTTNGGTQTISAGGAPKVVITGSTASSTFNLPTSSLVTGQELVIVNNASVSITLAGNGNNIDSSASLTMAANSRRTVSWNGTSWDLIASVG